MRRLLLSLTLAGTVLLAGCTTTTAPPSPSPSRAPGVRLTDASATAVVDAASAGQRAVEASADLFATAPGVVLAPEGDPAAQRAAADVAVRLHVPLLLVPAEATPTATASPTETATPIGAAPPGAAAAEAHRLGARWSVGRGLRLPGLRPRSAADVRPAPAPRAGRLVALASQAGADIAALATARAAGAQVVELPNGADLNGDAGAVHALAAAPGARAVLVGAAFSSRADVRWSVAAARTGWTYADGAQRAFDGRSLHVALYGTPGDGTLGVLGQQSEPATLARVRSLSAQYAALTSRTVSPMLEVIATVASGGPTDDHDYSGEIDPQVLAPYVDAALAAHVPVILDLQPGRQDFLSQAKQYASLLEKPGVGLALDAEWRLGPTQKPLVQIGRVSADEVNRTSAWLADLVRTRDLPPKPFVLHEFRLSMLQDRSSIVVDRPELDTLIHVDGQGTQPDKQATWRAVRQGAPAVGWGWKNFLKKDLPVLTPAQTLQQVHPTPDLITYQ